MAPSAMAWISGSHNDVCAVGDLAPARNVFVRLTHNCQQDRYNGSRAIMTAPSSQPTVMSHVGQRWSLKAHWAMYPGFVIIGARLSSPGVAWLATSRSRHCHELCSMSPFCRT